MNNSRFIAPNYGLMRHLACRFESKQRPLVVVEECLAILPNIMIGLSVELERLGHKKVLIVHSLHLRAEVSALHVKEMLQQLGLEVSIAGGFTWLDTDGKQSHPALFNHLQAVERDDEDVFLLAITHLPEIAKCIHGNPENHKGITFGAIFSQHFEVRA